MKVILSIAFLLVVAARLSENRTSEVEMTEPNTPEEIERMGQEMVDAILNERGELCNEECRQTARTAIIYRCQEDIHDEICGPPAKGSKQECIAKEEKKRKANIDSLCRAKKKDFDGSKKKCIAHYDKMHKDALGECVASADASAKKKVEADCQQCLDDAEEDKQDAHKEELWNFMRAFVKHQEGTSVERDADWVTDQLEKLEKQKGLRQAYEEATLNVKMRELRVRLKEAEQHLEIANARVETINNKTMKKTKKLSNLNAEIKKAEVETINNDEIMMEEMAILNDATLSKNKKHTHAHLDPEDDLEKEKDILEKHAPDILLKYALVPSADKYDVHPDLKLKRARTLIKNILKLHIEKKEAEKSVKDASDKVAYIKGRIEKKFNQVSTYHAWIKTDA